MTASSAAPAPAPTQRRRVAINTAIFSVATGLSRIAGLIREVVASSYFGTSGPASAFTLAFQVPNLVRSLFADAAISAAFVPVFTEMLERGEKKDAFRLASTLFWVILLVLGAITAVFILAAGVVMPLFTHGFGPDLSDLTVGLSRVLFPIVVLLGLNGLVVGILNAHDHFSIPALAPLVWNLVIIVGLVVLRGLWSGENEIYAYAVAVLAGTVVQFAMALPQLRGVGFRLRLDVDWRDPRIGQVFRLMLPVTVGLGVINFDLVINSTLGAFISDQAPRAIDAAFRIYMLPQGMFSVALATVLFPALSRYAARRDLAGLGATMANGVRQIALLLLPAAAATVALATPIVRLVYERGAFGNRSTELVAEALFWFSFSLPFAGMNLLMTRAFFSLQRPWTPTALAAGSLLLNALVSLALYRPLGIAGPVIGTAVASAAMTLAQGVVLQRRLGTTELRATVLAIARMVFAATAFGVVAWWTWWGLDDALGRGFLAQLVSVGLALTAATLVYVGLVLLLRIREAQQIRALLASRLRRPT